MAPQTHVSRSVETSEGQPRSSEHGDVARLLQFYAYFFFTEFQEVFFVHHIVISLAQNLLPICSEVGRSKYMS